MSVVDLDLNAAQQRPARRRRYGGQAARPVARTAELCIVVPTYNERDNLAELIERVSAAMRGLDWEMIIVDDESPDGTAGEVRALGQHDPRIRLMRRIGRRGPASACLEGLLASNAPLLAVMDGDLQHDPLLLRAMVAMLRNGRTDLIVASRRPADRSIGNRPDYRETARRLAIRAARTVGPVALSDPLSGYFAMRSEVIDRLAPRLAGVGGKLLLDILLAAPDLRVRELPAVFGPRMRGESKFSARIVWDYGLMLAQHRVGAVSGRFLSYLLIAAVALIVHAGAFWLFHDLYGLGPGGAQFIAGMALCVVTYGLQQWLSYRRSGPWRWYLGLLPFLATRTIGLLAAVLVARWLVGSGLGVPISAFAGAVALVWWNYDAVQRYGAFAR